MSLFRSAEYCENCEGEEENDDINPCMLIDGRLECAVCADQWQCSICGFHVSDNVAENNDETCRYCAECNSAKICSDHVGTHGCQEDDCGKDLLCAECIVECTQCESTYCEEHIEATCGICRETKLCIACHEDEPLRSCGCNGVQDACKTCLNEIGAYYCDDCDDYVCEDCRHHCRHDDVNINMAGLNLGVPDTAGGVYCLQITHINGHPIQFYRGNVLTDLVLIKFGRTDNFSRRSTQFSFRFLVIFVRDLPTTAEGDILKNIFCPNFKTTFYPDSKVATIHSSLKLGGSPGCTEWRVVTESWLTKLRHVAPTLTAGNYGETFSNELRRIPTEDLNFSEREISLQVNNYKRNNVHPFKVYNVN